MTYHAEPSEDRVVVTTDEGRRYTFPIVEPAAFSPSRW